MTIDAIARQPDELRQRFSALQPPSRLPDGRWKALRPRPFDDPQRSMSGSRASARELLAKGDPAPIVSRVSGFALAEASLDALIIADLRGRVVQFNAAAGSMFGYTAADVVGREVADIIVPSQMRKRVRAAFAEIRSTGHCHWLGRRFDAPAMKSDGSRIPVEIAVTCIAGTAPPLLEVCLHDRAARKQATREATHYRMRLGAMSAELLLVEEAERRRLAADLHDGLSQDLALARMKLALLHASADAAWDCKLSEIEQLIEHANHSCRSITFELAPPVLHDLGLEPAVEWLVEDMRSRYRMQVALEDDGQPKPTDARTRTILFRAIRELLINAAKHARAQRVSVSLRCLNDDVQATVEDDGVGMQPDVSTENGFGLFSIRERLSQVGGRFDLRSSPGRGTSICLSAPLLSRRGAREVQRNPS